MTLTLTLIESWEDFNFSKKNLPCNIKIGNNENI